MKNLHVGKNFDVDGGYFIGYVTEKGFTDDHVFIPFTEVTPALSRLLGFLESALQAEAEQREKARVSIGGKVYERGAETDEKPERGPVTVSIKKRDAEVVERLDRIEAAICAVHGFPARTPDGDDL